jgi:biotin carboxylase
VDTAAYADAVVPPYYDSLIAKLIAHGVTAPKPSRACAALDGFLVEGIKTTIPLHKRILVDPDFVAGKFDTSFDPQSGTGSRGRPYYGGLRRARADFWDGYERKPRSGGGS